MNKQGQSERTILILSIVVLIIIVGAFLTIWFKAHPNQTLVINPDGSSKWENKSLSKEDAFPNIIPLNDSRNNDGKCKWYAAGKVQGYLPDPVCTPGDVLSFDMIEICRSGYSASVRDVDDSLRERVYSEYGITDRGRGDYEVDHLIPLSIGGSNDISNLWPQPASPEPGYKQKDSLESCIHRMVCEDMTLGLEQAQLMFIDNWLALQSFCTT